MTYPSSLRRRSCASCELHSVSVADDDGAMQPMSEWMSAGTRVALKPKAAGAEWQAELPTLLQDRARAPRLETLYVHFIWSRTTHTLLPLHVADCSEDSFLAPVETAP
eukprot:4312622-Pleurochrysis_carterae.AAC.2